MTSSSRTGFVRPLVAALVVGLSVGAAGGAAVAVERAPRSDAWQGTLGLRATFIRDAGLDPFATQDAFPQLSLGLLREVTRSGPLSLFGGVGWDIGTSDASARGVQTHLTLNHPSVVVELRHRPIERLYLFVRVAPGLLHAVASLDDSSSPGPLQTTFNSFAVDGSGGVGVRVNGARDVVGAWVRLEGGYGWTSSHDMSFKPGLGGADASKAGGLALSPLAARGAFLRAALAISY